MPISMASINGDEITSEEVTAEQLTKDRAVKKPVETMRIKEEAVVEEDASVGDLFGALFSSENSVGSFLTNKVDHSDFTDPDYDLVEDFEQLPQEYQDNYSDSFFGARNKKHFESIKQQIDQEVKNNQIISQWGYKALPAAFLVGLLDPINFIPIGGSMLKMSKGAKSLKNVLGNSAKIATVGAASASVQETALHATQETRTLGDSVAAVGTTAFVGGILGAGGTLLAKKQGKFDKIVEETEKDFDLVKLTEEEIARQKNPISLSSAAAPKAAEVSIRDLTLKGAAGIQKIALDPGTRVMGSELKNSRIAMLQLADTNKVVGNKEGFVNPQSIETLIKLDKGLEGQAVRSHLKQYKEYRKKNGGNVLHKLPGVKGNYLTKHEFNEEVGKAMVRGDQHEISEVANSAKEFRKLFDFFKDKAVDQGLLPEDVDPKTASSYFSRLWNSEAINQNYDTFIAKTVNWAKKEAMKEIETKGDNKTLSKFAEAFTEGDEQEFISLAQRIANKIRGLHSGDNNSFKLEDDFFKSTKGAFSGPAKFLKERTFLIPDEEILDFIELDVEAVLHSYTRTMAPITRIAEKMGSDFLTATKANQSEVTARILDEKNQAEALLGKTKKAGKERSKLDRQFQADMRDIFAVRDRLLGTYGMPKDPNGFFYRAGRVATDINPVRLLGGVVKASLADAGKIVMVDGYSGVFKDVIKPMVRSLKEFKKLGGEIQDLRGGFEMEVDSRAMNMADIFDDYGRATTFERVTRGVSSTFPKYTGISAWNFMVKQVSGRIVLGKLNRLLSKKKALTAKEEADLNFVGIGKDMRSRIKSQMDQYGVETKGVFSPNAADWDDMEAVETLRAALVKTVDQTIVTPGVADRPLVLSSPVGKVIGQFKSFMFASQQKTLIPMLQERDFKTLQGLTTMVGLGVVTAMLTAIERGENIDDFEVADWIALGVDRSGALGIFGEVDNMLSRTTGFGVSKLLGLEHMNRYSSRNKLDALLGPSAGMLSDTISILDENFTDADVRRIRRLLPYQNLTGLRNLLDLVQEEAITELGLERR